MIDLNALQKYMDFYKANLRQPDYSAHNGFNPTPNNPSGDAAAWAMRAMGDQGNGRSPMPDFFGANPTPQVNPYMARVQSLQDQPFASQPNRGAVTNYLARLLK